jgi:hypothetical protein
LEILRKNKQEHKEIFLEALEGYRKQVVKLLEERLERVKNGKNFDLYFHLTQPVDQTKDYERAIGMLEMSLGDDVELSEMDYQQYVLDDWNWKTNFLTSNAFYSQKAAATVAATMTTSA